MSTTGPDKVFLFIPEMILKGLEKQTTDRERQMTV